MSSAKTSSTRGTGTTLSKSSITSSYTRQFKETFFELLLNLNNVKRFTLDRWILLGLEMISLILFIVVTFKSILLWDEDVASVTKYIFVPMDPMLVASSFVGYLIVFLLGCGYICVGFGLLLYASYTKTSNEIVCTLCFWFCRVTRTLFLYPLLHVFVSPMNCDFSGSLTMKNYGEYSCVEFPFLLFWILGVVCVLITFIVGTIDALFILDKFRGIDTWTSSPDGRFNFLIFATQVVSAILCQTMMYQHLLGPIIGCIILSLVLLLVSILFLVRFIPYFHFQYVCIVGTLLCIVLNVKFTYLIFVATNEWYMLSLLIFTFFFVPMLWIALCGRYACLLRFFRKNKIRSNIFVCYFSADIVIGLYVKEKFDQLFCIGKLKKRVHPKGSKQVNMMNVVTTLLNDEDFEKTKNLCQMLTTICLEKSPQLAKLILNHTSTIMREDLLDVELSLQFYKLKTTDIQHSGSSAKKKLKLIGELNRAMRRENELAKMLQMLFQELSAEDRKVSFANFPQIFTSIQSNHEFCESTYEKLVRVTPCSRTYKAYANYLIRFLNDKKRANLYIKEARQLAFTQSDGSDHTTKAPSEILEFERRVEEEKKKFTPPASSVEMEVTEENITSTESETDEEPSPTEEEDSSVIDRTEEEEEEEYVEDRKTFSRGNSDVIRMVKDHGIELTKEDLIKEPEMKNSVSSNQITPAFEELELTADNKTEVSYQQKDSVITKQTSSSTGSDVRSHLFKKVSSGTYCSTWLVRALCCGVFFAGASMIILIFTMSFVLRNDFKSSAELVVLASDLQKSVTEAAHFIRKLQVSEYNAEDTPFGYERDNGVVEELVLDHCDKVLTRANDLYEGMNAGQGTPWTDVTLMLVEHVLEHHEDARDHEYFVEDYSLIDGTLLYGEKCLYFWKTHEPYVQYLYTDNFTIGNRMQDDEAFIFVTMNEPPIYEGLEILKEHLTSYEEDDSFRLQMVYIIIPCAMCLLFPWICCVWFVYCCQQRRTFKGLMLIPKQQLYEIQDKMGSESSQARVDTTRCSLIQRFTLLMCATVFLLIVISSVFTTIGVLTCNQFKVRNLEYEYTLEISVLVRRVHLWATELVYREDTLFEDQEIVDGIDADLMRLAEVYGALRFGSEEYGLSGNDQEPTAHRIYYDDNCDTTLEYSHRYDYLCCLSLNHKIELIIQNGEDLLRENYTDKSIRGSPHYEAIIMLDNYNNGSIFDEGAIQDQLEELEEYTKGKVDVYHSYLESFSLLLLILGLPLFLGLYCILFRNAPKRLNRNLSMVRRVMMLMDKRVLMSKNIYEYVSGKTRFKTVFSREKKNRIDEACDTLEHHSYGMIMLNKKFTIIRYNITANELFNIKASEAKDLSHILSKASFNAVTKWARGKKKVFSGELMAIYNDQEYCVLADISRGETLYSGIFENLESSKKKDLLKESERLDQKTMALVSNILPREIAQGMKVDDLLKGNCLITEHKKATAYFSDICDFTGMAQTMETQEIIELLHDFFSRIDDLCDQYELEKIKTIGDCYFAISGIPTYKPLHAKMAMDFAIAVLKMIHELNKTRDEGKKIYVRTGLSSGNLVAGIIGKRKFCYDTWGPMINEAARMEHHGHPGKIQVSRATYESIFDKYDFMEKEIHLQGIGVRVKAYVHTPSFIDEEEAGKRAERMKFKEISNAGVILPGEKDIDETPKKEDEEEEIEQESASGGEETDQQEMVEAGGEDFGAPCTTSTLGYETPSSHEVASERYDLEPQEDVSDSLGEGEDEVEENGEEGGNFVED